MPAKCSAGRGETPTVHVSNCWGLLPTIFQGETTDTYTQVANTIIKMGKGDPHTLEHEMSFLMICKEYALG